MIVYLFSGLLALLWTKIDWFFIFAILSSTTVIVVVLILFVSFWCLSSHLQFPSFFLHWYWIVPIDCMADCNYDSDPSVWFTDWFCLLSSSLLLLRFIVVLRSFVTSFVFNHGITSYCLLIETRPSRCWWFVLILV